MNSRIKGAAIVEFARAALLFFTVLFAIIDFAYLFWVNLTMQHAVREGARLAVTGQILVPNPNPANPAQDRYDTAVDEMRKESMGLWSRVSPVVSVQTIDEAGNILVLPPNNIGVGGQIIVISVDCTVPLLTPFIRPFFLNGQYQFRVRTTMKNEAFR